MEIFVHVQIVSHKMDFVQTFSQFQLFRVIANK